MFSAHGAYHNPAAGYAAPSPSFHLPAAQPLAALSSEDVNLWMRQEPKEALLCVDGKEKTSVRKPVDPPPIIQLEIGGRADPMQHFLQSPYLFMCASLWHPENDHPWQAPASKSLAGSMVSSLHRLKDVDNKDGAFFVFGDISVKQKGRFRLRFSLFDFQKTTGAALYLGCVTSQPFTVDLAKDYKGLAESTYLSRAFSDQGVRLRLRKEPRTMLSSKRSYAALTNSTSDQVVKRVRTEDDEEERKPQTSYSQPLSQPLSHAAPHSIPPPMPQSTPQSMPQPMLQSTLQTSLAQPLSRSISHHTSQAIAHHNSQPLSQHTMQQSTQSVQQSLDSGYSAVQTAQTGFVPTGLPSTVGYYDQSQRPSWW